MQDESLWHTMQRQPKWPALVSAILLTLAACGGGRPPPDPAPERTQRAGRSAGTVPAANAGANAGATTDTRSLIVVFRPHVPDPASKAASLWSPRGGRITHLYSAALKGFAVTLPAAEVGAFLAATAGHPDVDYVQADRPVSTSDTLIQHNATWGLDRADQRHLPLNKTYRYFATGRNVHVYVVDTGIRRSHKDFEGRVLAGYSALGDTQGTSDCNGHGTHVAGTIGGKTWGIAKQTLLVPVRVLDCAGWGWVSNVIAGLDWVLRNSSLPAVVNMSLRVPGNPDQGLNQAVQNTVESGIPVVVAAGNDSDDACAYSPAAEPSAITVAATTRSDARASYSNFGSCVDLFAPGSSVKSAWATSDSATNTISGTSMAAPHVAGTAALVLQSTPGATPAQVADAILGAATPGLLTEPGPGSPNLLLYTGLPDNP